MPVGAEFATVAPVNAQVNLVTEQLSAIAGFEVVTLAVQVPAPTFGVKFAGQVMVGLILSKTVTVYEQFAKLPAASSTRYVTVVNPKLNT